MPDETWLEKAKARVAEQKRLFRDSGSKSPSKEMLKIGDTNFLITEKQAKLILTLELVCEDLRSNYEAEDKDWEWLEDICNLAKIHQMGTGEPADFRRQFLEAIRAEYRSDIADKWGMVKV